MFDNFLRWQSWERFKIDIFPLGSPIQSKEGVNFLTRISSTISTLLILFHWIDPKVVCLHVFIRQNFTQTFFHLPFWTSFKPQKKIRYMLNNNKNNINYFSCLQKHIFLHTKTADFISWSAKKRDWCHWFRLIINLVNILTFLACNYLVRVCARPKDGKPIENPYFSSGS